MSKEYSEENKPDYKNLDDLNSLHMKKGQLYETIVTTRTSIDADSFDNNGKIK